ncbi:MAG: hypothetical protein M0P92_06795 [Acholeplasmataceae bacterium]|jgi:hypothetical protein|nr:hypothetical protein [Acholeplasmataceae bacterium]
MAQYVSDSEMTAYAADRPDSTAWTGASSAEKEDALKYASKLVDSLPFVGKKYETDISSQPLQWPRLIKTRHGWVVADRDADDNVVVPQAIKDAVCEEILARLDTTNDKRRALQEGGVTYFKLGELWEEYDGSLRGGGIEGTPLRSWTAYRLLEPYLAKGARAR